MSTKGIPKTIIKAGNSAKKFLEKLEEISLEVNYGKKTFTSKKLAEYRNPENPGTRKKILNEASFFKDPSVTSLTTLMKTLNGYELCNPASFAINQAFPPGSPVSDKFLSFQGKIGNFFEKARNFSLVPGPGEVTAATIVGNPIELIREQKITISLPPQNTPYSIYQDSTIIFKTQDPKFVTTMRGRVIGIDGNNFTVGIEFVSSIDPPIDPKTKEPALFSVFDIEYDKTISNNVYEISQELASVAELLREIGYQDILNDLNGIPSSFPGVGKIKSTFTKVGAFIDKIGTGAAQIGDEADDASQFLAGGLTSRDILEGSRLFQDFFRKIEPILNFQSTLTTGYKNVIEDLNNILRNAIPFGELSKFVKFVVDFAKIIQGIVSMLIVLLKTLNTIVKTITTILKVFRVIIKVVKAVAMALPTMFLTAGIVQQLTDKIDQAEEALGLAINFLEGVSRFLERIARSLGILKNGLQVLIVEGSALAAKLGSCAALSGNGMGAGMEAMVNNLRASLRDLTGALPGEDYYDDPNSPGRGLSADQLPDGVNSFIRLPNGEIMFLNDSIIGFDENGNLIFFGDLTSLSTGVNFNDTLGQSFRNRNLSFYTFDKFRNSQASMLDEADRLAAERNTVIQEVDPSDRFGNFAEKYLGYTIKIQEEREQNPNAQKASRRRGIALDSLEKIAVSTELTFSDNLSGIVNEVKFLLRRDIDAGILGVNTSDTQPNEITDSDALNLAKTTGANPIVMSNIEAENNNRAATEIPTKPETTPPLETRVGNRPFIPEETEGFPAKSLPDKSSPRKPLNVQNIAQEGIQDFIKESPSLSSLSANLGTINRATPSQLSNILKEPGIENLSEEELLQKLKGEILSSVDPNPEKVDEVKEKTRQWYEGLRSKARVDFDRKILSSRVPSKVGGPIVKAGESYEFEPYISKIELQEIPKWVKLLLRSGYTQLEVDAGLSGEGIKDKYEIKTLPSGKIEIQKKLAFKEGNF